ncbi:DUF4198 domain-containing protein [Sphingomonas profundi]|uniref:DUF4198 domain-containing protein n=1 Tax=Alterirhizorhabdus profundi TaxID=2681549 RepID=UPI001E4637C3|nr:DUF4198 domain-containing protein [Sphingomonas profundi]
MTIMLGLLAMPAAAHDFWIDLPRYRQESGRPFAIAFLIGDAGASEPWETRWRRIVSLRSYGPAGVADQQAGIRETAGTTGGGASVTLGEAGTHVIAFESQQAENDISAAEFNAYAAHEGLAPAIAWREAHGQTKARGRELYARRAKALVQIGGTPTDDATRRIGQTLEIVPERNPYALAPRDPLVVRVYYHGVPLAGASVVLERLDGQHAHGTPVISDAAGRVAFPPPGPGRWRVGTVWTQPIEHPRAEFDTIFASLTFGT